MKTGWQQVYGKWYYLGKENDGAMKYYWQKIDGKYYWLGHGNDGAMKTYWQKVNNATTSLVQTVSCEPDGRVSGANGIT